MFKPRSGISFGYRHLQPGYGKCKDKPGFWFDGNLHASEVMGKEKVDLGHLHGHTSLNPSPVQTVERPQPPSKPCLKKAELAQRL